MCGDIQLIEIQPETLHIINNEDNKVPLFQQHEEKPFSVHELPSDVCFSDILAKMPDLRNCTNPHNNINTKSKTSNRSAIKERQRLTEKKGKLSYNLLLKRLCQLRRLKRLCDVVLVALDGTSIEVHSAVLAGASPVLRHQMLALGMGSYTVHLGVKNKKELHIFVNYLYMQRHSMLTSDSSSELHAILMELFIPLQPWSPFESLNREHGQYRLCDVVVECPGGKQYSTHSCVLAAICPPLQTILAMCQPGRKHICVDMSSNPLQKMLDDVYSLQPANDSQGLNDMPKSAVNISTISTATYPTKSVLPKTRRTRGLQPSVKKSPNSLSKNKSTEKNKPFVVNNHTQDTNCTDVCFVDDDSELLENSIKIVSVSSLQTVLPDTPNTACPQPLNSVIETTSPHTTIEENNMQERSLLCKCCGKHFDSSQSLDAHQTDMLQRPYGCAFCKIAFVNESSRSEHEQTSHQSQELFPCEQCGKIFSLQSSLSSHIQMHNKVPSKLRKRVTPQKKKDIVNTQPDFSDNTTSTADDDRPKLSIKLEIVRCKFCSQHFTSSARLSSHIEQYHKRSRRCKQHPVNYSAPELSSSEQDDVSGAENDDEYITPKLEEREHKPLHKKKSHKTRTGHREYKAGDDFKCPVCSKVLSSKTSFDRHQMIHTGECPYSCPICERPFRDKHAMQRHQIIHQKERKCVKCCVMFTSQEALEKHEMYHNDAEKDKTIPRPSRPRHRVVDEKMIEELPFFCKLCGRRFKKKKYMQKHFRMKHGDNQGQSSACRFCGKVFSENAEVIKHERCHTGEKPYNCRYCKKPFRQVSQRNVHERTHTGERPHECQYCHQRFRQSAARDSHERIHTGEMPFPCSHCNKSFRVCWQRGRHERTVHRKKDYSGRGRIKNDPDANGDSQMRKVNVKSERNANGHSDAITEHANDATSLFISESHLNGESSAIGDPSEIEFEEVFL